MLQHSTEPIFPFRLINALQYKNIPFRTQLQFILFGNRCDRSFFNKLPGAPDPLVLSPLMVQQNRAVCSICWDAEEDPQELLSIHPDREHRFHTTCLMAWALESGRLECPICRCPSTEEVEMCSGNRPCIRGQLLVIAAHSGNINIAKILLRDRVDVAHKEQALIISAANGFFDFFKLVLSKVGDCPVDRVEIGLAATSNHHFDILDHLLSFETDITLLLTRIMPRFSASPLATVKDFLARYQFPLDDETKCELAKYVTLEVMHFYCTQMGAIPTQKCLECFGTHGKFDIVRDLHALGIDTSLARVPLLFYAAQSDNFECFKFLLATGHFESKDLSRAILIAAHHSAITVFDGLVSFQQPTTQEYSEALCAFLHSDSPHLLHEEHLDLLRSFSDLQISQVFLSACSSDSSNVWVERCLDKIKDTALLDNGLMVCVCCVSLENCRSILMRNIKVSDAVFRTFLSTYKQHGRDQVVGTRLESMGFLLINIGQANVRIDNDEAVCVFASTGPNSLTGSMSLMMRCIELGADPMAQNSRPWIEVFSHGYLWPGAALVRYQKDLTVANHIGIVESVRAMEFDMVRFLHNVGVDVAEPNFLPFKLAAVQNDMPTLKLIWRALMEDPPVDQRRYPLTQETISELVINGAIDSLRFLFAKDAILSTDNMIGSAMKAKSLTMLTEILNHLYSNKIAKDTACIQRSISEACKTDFVEGLQRLFGAISDGALLLHDDSVTIQELMHYAIIDAIREGSVSILASLTDSTPLESIAEMEEAVQCAAASNRIEVIKYLHGRHLLDLRELLLKAAVLIFSNAAVDVINFMKDHVIVPKPTEALMDTALLSGDPETLVSALRIGCPFPSEKRIALLTDESIKSTLNEIKNGIIEI